MAGWELDGSVLKTRVADLELIVDGVAQQALRYRNMGGVQ